MKLLLGAIGALVVVVAGVAFLMTPSPLASEQTPPVHPKKAIYENQAEWPAVSPADVTLQNFRPFRAVYVREYVQGGGPNAGEPRTDRVIVTAENIGWDGVDAVAIQMIDSGIVDKPDTNARTLTMMVAKTDLRLLFEIGPAPGTAKDYYIIHALPDKIVGSMVTTAAPALEPRVVDTSEPGFGPLTWAIANLDVTAGQKVRLGPSGSPTGNPLSPASFGHVLRQETFTDLKGREFDNAWLTEMVTSLTNERAYRVFTRNEPPYFLGTASWNVDTDAERYKFVWLTEFTYLEDGMPDGSR